MTQRDCYRIEFPLANGKSSSAKNNPRQDNLISQHRTNISPTNSTHKSYIFSIITLFALIQATILIIPVKCDLTKRSPSTSLQKPSISLIVPQSFKLAANYLLSDHNHGPAKKQYVAIINNIQSERENNIIRQQYKRLSLQIRDARHPKTGQLFYEHIFDYFPQDPQQQHLLLPVDLGDVSFSPEDHSSNSNGRTSRPRRSNLRQVILSIRPHQAISTTDSVELVSSAPILIETVHSHDARRSFGIVQTDKPIYKPEDKVRIRALVINEDFKPVVRDELKIQIKNPHMITVEEVRFPSMGSSDSKPISGSPRSEPLFFDHTFEFPPEPMLGRWTVNLVHKDAVANDTVEFQVKEYVLPTFEVKFQTPKYILPWSKNITGYLVAKYHYGKPVQGTVSFKYGLKESSQSVPRLVGRSDFKPLDPNTGRVNFNLTLDRFKDRGWFPQISGSYLFVEATVTNETSGVMEVVQDANCRFVSMPYKISFDKSIEYFKPGLAQQLIVRLYEHNTELPPPVGSRIVAEYRDKNDRLLSAPISISSSMLSQSTPILSLVDTSRQLGTVAITDSEGRATFKVGPVSEDLSELRVRVKYLNPNLQEIGRNDYNQSELASAEIILKAHESKNGWLSIMNKGLTQLNLGDQFTSELLIEGAPLKPSRTYYMILARGEIVAVNPLDADGLVRFKITQNMVPSIRLIVFAHRQDSLEVLSDSMRIDVSQSLSCGLNLKFISESFSDQDTFRPNEKGKLSINARPGDQVALIGVDSALYTLNNQSRLESSRIIERVRLLDPGCGFGDGQNSLDVFLNAGLMFYTNSFDMSSSFALVGSSCNSIVNQQKQIQDMKYGYTRPSLSAPSNNWRKELGNILSRLSPFGRSERKKRDVDSESLLGSYDDPKEKACCLLGTYDDSPKARSCASRADIVRKHMEQIGFTKCSQIYFDCCQAINENLVTSSLLARSIPHEEVIPAPRKVGELFAASNLINLGWLSEIEEHTFIRKDFRETWLFDVIQTDDIGGNASINLTLPHSLTTWSVSALALNLNEPMCLISQPYKLVTFQDIILQVSMPYKVIESEQIDLVATVFNYSPDSQEVFIYMYGIQDVCSEAEPGERSDRIREIIQPNSFSSVVFPIIPLRIGKFKIKVLAITKSSDLSDIVEKELNVVSKGRPVTDETTFKLDPMNQQRRNKRSIQTGNLLDDIDESRGLQRSKIRLAPTRDSEFIVPKTQECIVSAIGNKLGQSIHTALLDVENLIRLPHGCGEQVMIYFGPTLYALRYLNSVNKLTGDSRWRAIRYMQSGYKRVLNYRKETGAFSAFPGREPSKWLTAFVAKLLCQAERTNGISNELHIDRNVISSALDWLISSQDNSTGRWIEENPVYHREMLGGVLKENALTSFVAVTLEECSLVDFKAGMQLGLTESADSDTSITPTNLFDRLRMATLRAETSLISDRHRALKAKSPYVLALTAYALSFSKPAQAHATLDDLMSLSERLVSRNQIYWRGQNGIETAAYALQTIVQLASYLADHVNQPGRAQTSHWSPPDVALAISNWLTSQHSYTGAFESTQDTIVALDALSRLAQAQAEGTLATQSQSQTAPNLTCDVKLSNITKRSIEFSEENALVLQSFKLDKLQPISDGREELEIITSGSGVGTMTVGLKYNVLNEEDELCRFSIDSTIKEWRPKVDQANGDILVGNEFKKVVLNVVEDLDLGSVEGLVSPSERPTLKPLQMLRVRRGSPAPIMDLSLNTTGTTGSTDNSSWTSWLRSKFRDRFFKSSSTNQTNATTSSSPKNQNRPVTTVRPNLKLEDWPRVGETLNHQQTGDRRNGTSRRSVPKESRSDQAILSSELNVLSPNLTTSSGQSSSLRPSNKLYLLLEICVRYIYSRREPDMSVIEVKILSGFKPNIADLQLVLNATGTPAYKYETSHDQSLVVFYLRTIPSSGPYCLQFRLVPETTVRNLQSGYIRVYEYYMPTHSCSNYYSPTRQTELLNVDCTSSKVCQCVSKNKCPSNQKLVDLGSIQSVNATSARNQITTLACSDRFDYIAIVNLKSVKEIENQQRFKIFVKVKQDIKGNLTKIIEAQRMQTSQSFENTRKPNYLPTDAASISLNSASTNERLDLEDEDAKTPLELLALSIDKECLKNDTMLQHLAYPNYREQGGFQMILFGRYSKIDRSYFRVRPKSGLRSTIATGVSRTGSTGINSPDGRQLEFDDSNLVQYSTLIYLDRESILHDMTYMDEENTRKPMNILTNWLALKTRKSGLPCSKS